MSCRPFYSLYLSISLQHPTFFYICDQKRVFLFFFYVPRYTLLHYRTCVRHLFDQYNNPWTYCGNTYYPGTISPRQLTSCIVSPLGSTYISVLTAWSWDRLASLTSRLLPGRPSLYSLRPEGEAHVGEDPQEAKKNKARRAARLLHGIVRTIRDLLRWTRERFVTARESSSSRYNIDSTALSRAISSSFRFPRCFSSANGDTAGEFGSAAAMMLRVVGCGTRGMQIRRLACKRRVSRQTFILILKVCGIALGCFREPMYLYEKKTRHLNCKNWYFNIAVTNTFFFFFK